MTLLKPSRNLFRPNQGLLASYAALPEPEIDHRASAAAEALKNLFTVHYPCVAGMRAFHRDEYKLGVYGELGLGESWRMLRNDLEYFASEYQRTKSTYLTFFAVFNEQNFSPETFENAMWRELSYLSSQEDKALDWKDPETADPASKKFLLSIGGTEFFVVGMHPQSPRIARRLPFPAMVFNIFDQFAELQRQGVYDQMVKTIRSRDQKLQGTVNPMVEKHGEVWESIQFSGNEHPSTWKCPFHHPASKDKPGN